MRCTSRGPSWSRFAVSLTLTLFPGTIGYAGEWKSGGPYGANIRTVLVDPRTPPTVYVGTDGNGIFKSTDGGATWTAAKSGLPCPECVKRSSQGACFCRSTGHALGVHRLERGLLRLLVDL